MCHGVDDVVDPRSKRLRRILLGIMGTVGPFPGVAVILIEAHRHHDTPAVVINAAPVWDGPILLIRMMKRIVYNPWHLNALVEVVQHVKDGIAVLQLSQKYASWDSTPTEADIQGFYSSEPDFFLVAELNRRIVGFVYGRESTNVPDEVLRRWRATKVGSVEVLAVEEQYRRRGIATLLLNRLFVVFRERGIDTVTLSVPADERGAKELYDKLGFETRGFFMKKTL